MKYSMIEIGIAAMELDRMSKSPNPKVSDLALSIKKDRNQFYRYVEFRRKKDNKPEQTIPKKSFFSKLIFWR